ncbi:MAG: biotin/lipoate A/B protein ligase family protein [Methanomassiliicoccales archaeon]
MRYETHPASMNMAIDEAIVEMLSFNEASPTIRFYGWDPSAVSIGCFQNLEDEVDVDRCKELGIDIVRRRTGGGAVYHDKEGEITYSVICPETMIDKDINAAYRQICGWIINGLKMVGISAEFRPINDITVNGKKISGSAQTRRSGIFTQHGTVLFRVDPDVMFSVLKVDVEKVASKGTSNLADLVTSVSKESTSTKNEVLAALVYAFAEGKDWYLGAMSQDELSRSEAIAHERYGNDAWTRSC